MIRTALTIVGASVLLWGCGSSDVDVPPPAIEVFDSSGTSLGSVASP